MTVLNDWLESKYDISIRSYNKRREMYDESIWYVTDLIRCGGNRRNLTAHESAKLSIKPPIVIGNLVHDGIQSIFERDGWMSEVSSNKTIDNYTIRARCDMIRDNELIEIKYTSYIPKNHWASKRNNIDQCKIYNNLFDTDVVHLIFLSPKKLLQIDIRDEFSDGDMIEMIENPKMPRYQIECKYCDVENCEHRV